jgi:hypothetical protein
VAGNLPAAAIKNPDGRYAAPTTQATAVALTKATVNSNPHSADYLTENLDARYTFKNANSYPLSATAR